MDNRQFVLTTVGISLLLNSCTDPALRAQINRHANAVALDDGDLNQRVHALAESALAALREGDVARNRRLSAELNGLYGLYDGQIARGRDDIHYLIATDTELGRMAAGIVQTFLREQGWRVDTYTPEGLSAAEPGAFSAGIKRLMRWCEDAIPGYDQADYQVVFNLTGAFKSLQGYLNIVGMFYADRIVYIFESGSQLLSIPRLPLRVDVEALHDYRVEMALMAQGHVYPLEQVGGIPSGLLDVDEHENATLSDWGALIWGRARAELLSDDLLAFPRLQYHDNFRKDYKKASSAERSVLQETLAQVASLLESRRGDTAPLKAHGGLQYDVYTNKLTRDGRPIGHFRVSQGVRVSCTAEDGALRLRRYGEEPVVNNTP